MRRFRLVTLVLLTPALAFLAGLSGCGKKDAGPSGALNKPTGETSSPAASGAKTAIEAKTWANLKGKVTYDGDAPKDDGALKKQMEGQKDKDICLAGDTAAFAWRVNPENKGVENVLVFVEPPKDKYFKPNTPDEKTWKKDDVAVDQPHCAFEPHVLATFVSYYDGKNPPTPTNQKIIIKNSAPIAHNTKFAGDTVRNPGGNETIQPKDQREIKLKADPTTPITLNCNFHQWMTGYLWALDTPYYAVTDKDGNFEIKGIPAGTPVRVITWHEQAGFFNKGGKEGETMTLKDGDNPPLDLKVKAK